jgi:hypothetical protein|nr:MAG TPA: protein of unknown function (DUF4133) [Caudoviricetes sp.]
MKEWFNSLFGYRIMDNNDEIVYQETHSRLTFIAYLSVILGGIIYLLLPLWINAVIILVVCGASLSATFIRINRRKSIEQSLMVKLDSIMMSATLFILVNLFLNSMVVFGINKL